MSGRAKYVDMPKPSSGGENRPSEATASSASKVRGLTKDSRVSREPSENIRPEALSVLVRLLARQAARKYVCHGGFSTSDVVWPLVLVAFLAIALLAGQAWFGSK